MHSRAFPRPLHELELRCAELAPQVPDGPEKQALESRLWWLTGGRVHGPVGYVAGEIVVQSGIGGIDRALSRSGVR